MEQVGGEWGGTGGAGSVNVLHARRFTKINTQPVAHAQVREGLEAAGTRLR